MQGKLLKEQKYLGQRSFSAAHRPAGAADWKKFRQLGHRPFPPWLPAPRLAPQRLRGIARQGLPHWARAVPPAPAPSDAAGRKKAAEKKPEPLPGKEQTRRQRRQRRQEPECSRPLRRFL